MTSPFESLKAENLFPGIGPMMAAARRSHELAADAFDRTARLQLALAGDLLALNRKRFESLYAEKPLTEAVAEQQELALEAGRRYATFGEDCRELIGELQERAVETVAEAAPAATGKKKTGKGAKTAGAS